MKRLDQSEYGCQRQCPINDLFFFFLLQVSFFYLFVLLKVISESGDIGDNCVFSFSRHTELTQTQNDQIWIEVKNINISVFVRNHIAK